MSDSPSTISKRGRGPSSRVTEKVFAAILELLQESGFHSLTMEAIADCAGVHKTTLYRRWGSVNALLKEAIAIWDIGEPDFKDTGSLQSDLRWLAQQFAISFSKPETTAVLRMIAGSRDGDLVQVMNEYWMERASLFIALLERARTRGETVVDANLQMAMELMTGGMVLRILMLHQPLDDALIHHSADAAYRLLTNKCNG